MVVRQRGKVLEASESFEALLRKHARSMLQYADFVLNDLGSAEDAVQEAFVIAWRRRESLREGAAFAPWLRRIVLRECLRWRRHPWVRWLALTEHVVSGDLQPDTTQRVDIARAVSGLSPHLRAVIFLHFFEDLTLSAVAAELRIPEGNGENAALRGVAAARGFARRLFPWSRTGEAMKTADDLRRYVHLRAQSVPESEAARILDRATAAWRQPPRPWRRLYAVLAVGLTFAAAASIVLVQVWVRPRLSAPAKSAPTPVRHAFKAPEGIAIAPDGTVYVSDYSGQRVFRVEKDGRVAIFAGTGTFAEGGDGGPATKADLEAPSGMVFDRSGNLYVSDFWGNRIRRIDSHGNITTVAGSGPTGQNMSLSNPSYPSGSFAGDGGPATMASFYAPLGLALDSSGSLYVADSLSGHVRRIGRDGTITSLDASSLPDPIWLPRYLAFDHDGNLYVADGAPITAQGSLIGGCRIVRVSPTGTLSIVAGTGTCGFSGWRSGHGRPAQRPEWSRL